MHKFNPKNIEKLDNPGRRQNMPPLETLEKFKIAESGTFLDIGCGTGYFSSAAAEIMKSGKVIGIDTAAEMIDVAEKRSLGIENIEYRVSKEYSFPVGDQSVEYAFVSNVLHEIEDKPKYLEEIFRVLKSQGFLCVIEWEKKSMDMGPPVEDRIGIDMLKGLCKSNNLEFIEEVSIGNGHYGAKFRK